VTADRQVDINTTGDSSDHPFLGINTLDPTGGPGQTVSLIELTNNLDEQSEIRLNDATVNSNDSTEVTDLFKGEGVSVTNYFDLPSDLGTKKQTKQGTIEATLDLPPEVSIGSVREYDVTLDFTAETESENQKITLNRPVTVTYDDPRVSWWDFDKVERKDDNVEDEWRGIKGTLSGSGPYNSGPYPYSNGLWFDGYDVITVENPDSFNFKSGFSLSIWVWPGSQVNNLARLFSKWDSEGDDSYQLSIGQSDFEYADLSNNEILIETTEDFVPTNKTINNSDWQHIVWTHSSSSDVVYINADSYQIDTSLNDPEKSTANLRIGNGLNEWLQYGFRGGLYDPKVYNTALTSQQVTNLYGKNGGGGSIVGEDA
jgi:hypothetical protein